MGICLSYILAVSMLSWSAGAISYQGGSSFRAQKEFANLYLPQEYRRLDPSQIPETVFQTQRTLIEAALGSIYARLTIPVAVDGQSSTALRRYFPLIQHELEKIDPQAHVLPSGGVVRFALTYLYDQMLIAEAQEPGSAQRVLHRIAYVDEFDLPAAQVRGVGGDLDVFLLSNHFNQLKEKLLGLTNSAETENHFSTSSHSMKRVFFPVGDTKDYNEHIHRAANQGGSTVDLLAYDLKTKKIVDPFRFPQAFNDLIGGVIDYAPPVDSQAVEDWEKQLVRGLRSLVELPWVHYRDESILREELKQMIHNAERGYSPSAKALEQFGKTLRNARYGGAHNRFFRGEAESLDELVQKLLKSLYQLKGIQYFPEFIEHRPLENEENRDSFKEIPEKVLLRVPEFLEKFTDHSYVFHGTSTMDQAMAILRQGLILSKDSQGHALFGRGAYSSKNLTLAQKYSGLNGVVLKLKIKNDTRLRILDWSEVQHSAFGVRVQQEARQAQRDVFEILSRDYGIDIIVNEFVLLQNSSALDMADGLGHLLRGLQEHLLRKDETKTIPILEREMIEVVNLTSYSRTIGIIGSDSEINFYQKILDFWLKSKPLVKMDLIVELNVLAKGNPNLQKTLRSGPASRSLGEFFRAWHLLHRFPTSDQKLVSRQNDVTYAEITGQYLSGEALMGLIQTLNRKESQPIFEDIIHLQTTDLLTIQKHLTRRVDREADKMAAKLLSLTRLEDVGVLDQLAQTLKRNSLNDRSRIEAAMAATANTDTRYKPMLEGWLEATSILLSEATLVKAMNCLLRAEAVVRADQGLSTQFDRAVIQLYSWKSGLAGIPSLWNYVVNIRSLDPDIIYELLENIPRHIAIYVLKGLVSELPANHPAQNYLQAAVHSAENSVHSSRHRILYDKEGKNLVNFLTDFKKQSAAVQQCASFYRR